MSTYKRFLFIGGCADGEYHKVLVDCASRPQPEVRIQNKEGWSPHVMSTLAYHSYRAEMLREGNRTFWVYVSGIQPGDLIAELIAGYTPAAERRPKIATFTVP